MVQGSGRGSSARRSRTRGWAVVTGLVVVMSIVGAQVALAESPPGDKADHGLQSALDVLGGRARAHGLVNQAPPGAVGSVPVAANFTVLGHNALGGRNTFGDVAILGSTAYVGTWGDPCVGGGVKIIDVSDLAAPRVIGSAANRPGTSAEDPVVRHLETSAFSGDLLAVGLQRCGANRSLDRAAFGPEFWDVSDPRQPRKLSELGLTHGGSGVHEMDIVQQGTRAYALLATPFSEPFDPVTGGDFWIVDITDPRSPTVVAEWGALRAGLSRGPFWGIGSFGATFAHSVRGSTDGTTAWVSYWDQGVLTFDISDPTDPALVGATRFPPGSDGDAHSMTPYSAGETDFILQNDEDFDPRSPAVIRYGTSASGFGNESPFAPPLWFEPGHDITAAVVQAVDEGCNPSEYPAGSGGKIVVVRTPVPYFDAVGTPPACGESEQHQAALTVNPAAIVHDVVAENTSPQWMEFGAESTVPVLFTDHATAQGMVAAGSATLEAQEPTWGFLRVFDADTGQQVASFDDLPNVTGDDAFNPGFWSIHNTEVRGARAYASWYSNGVVALDLAPLDAAGVGDPVKVGQFVPPGRPGELAVVWGVAIRPSDGTFFVSDLRTGLWIVRPTGAAAP